ncbi:MAG TPA: hypothetical protein VFH47_05230, partial [Candidatus Thermoplasmatota archaeon]|nr:hypothetical protein [Candidatus Thermoplasmatota archaeon]
MRGPSAASVLTVAFVLASTSLLLPAPAAAQVADSVLQGMVCYQEEYGEPRPMPASGAPEPGPRGDGCYGQGVPGATVKASRQIASGLPADEKVTTADGNGFWALKGLLE